MGSSKQDISQAIGLDVVQLCDRYHALNRRRAELDQRIMALAEGDDEPDVLWQELGVVLAQGNTLVTQMAAAPADDRAGLQAKAAVLAFLLRSFETDSIYSYKETIDLALSVTDDVARLTW